MRTFGHEHSLPRVPLPDLNASCQRFLDWCTPLLTAEQLARTRAAVEEFRGGPGRTLQRALAEYDASPGVQSWLDTFWPSRYLGRRDRIALNANFFFLFTEGGPTAEPVDDADPQLSRAARLVAEAVELKVRLDDERVPPVEQRGRPQSMEQYKLLFSTTRIPGAEQDTVRSPYSAQHPGPSPARHIMVLVGGRMTRLDVLDADGRPFGVAAIAAALREVRRTAPAHPEESVGHLTTLPRAEWARRRDELLVLGEGNADAVEAVESALLCLCLDEFTPSDDLAACDRLLHGDSGNRWFDKALSLIVFSDGRAGVNVEHCGLDGTTILSFVDTILGPPADPATPRASGFPASQPVEFALDDELRAAARTAGEQFAAFAHSTATTCVSFTDFGADRAKKLGISPDAFVQMSYQLAHRRARGHLGATYESIATRQYRHGRTEAMRVVTPEVVEFVETLDDPGSDDAARREAFTAAAEAHVARAKDCQQGRAPEQHLWELQLIAARRGGGEHLALYDSPGWTIMRDDYLSTSSAPSTNIDYFGFGSTSSHCIGVAYVLLPERLNIYLSTPAAMRDAMHAFTVELRRAIDELAGLLSADVSAR